MINFYILLYIHNREDFIKIRINWVLTFSSRTQLNIVTIISHTPDPPKRRREKYEKHAINFNSIPLKFMKPSGKRTKQKNYHYNRFSHLKGIHK